jgi:hypothetical protein
MIGLLGSVRVNGVEPWRDSATIDFSGLSLYPACLGKLLPATRNSGHHRESLS